MKISIDGRVRNYIFISVLGAAVIFVSVVFAMAAEQDKIHRANFANYQQAVQLINQGQYAPAEELMAQLDENSRATYQVLYYRAYCATNTGDYSLAADYMQKVRETRPAILTDQNYLQQYGTILYYLQEYQRAKLYLLESRKYNNNSQATQEALKYLELIALKEKGGRE